MSYPVIGELRANAISEFLRSPYKEFGPAGGIRGLASVDDDNTLNLVAILSDDPGQGNFRDFMKECKTHYPAIRVWAVLNEDLPAVLTRYGFTKGHDMGYDGKMEEVWDWKRI